MTFYSTGELLQKVVSQNRANPPVKALHVFLLWEKAVVYVLGEKVGQKTRAISLKEDVLTVLVSGPVWMQELELQMSRLLQFINESSEKKIVQKIKFRIKR